MMIFSVKDFGFYRLVNFCLLILICGSNVNGEVFTALVDLEKLLEIERTIVSSLDSYLIGEERRLRQLKSIREKFASIESIASQDVQSYLANPVNAFLLVKTLTSDWRNGKVIKLLQPIDFLLIIINIDHHNYC